MTAPTTVTVRVRSIAFGGEGVGEVEAQHDGGFELLGITAFVPTTAPGERVRAAVLERKKRFVKTQLLEIESPSPVRVEPRCKHFGTCGGCELQHLAYEAQLDAKQEMIRGALAAGKLTSEVLAKLQPIEPGAPYGYRRRVSLHVDRANKIGFYRESSRSVVAVDSCPISVEAINDGLAKIRSLNLELGGKISSLNLEADETGLVAVLKAPYALADGERNAIIEKTKAFFPNVVLLVGEEEVGGVGRKIIELPLNEAATLSLRVTAGTFSQVNAEVNLKLIKAVLEEAGSERGAVLLDLFAGAGNFALPLAKTGFRVTAVESDRRLVEMGRQNAARYHLERSLNFVHSSVERYLSSRSREESAVVVADPPRSGLGMLVPELAAARLLLISCHLPSFVRDLKTLVGAGYRLSVIRPFDMFAETSYVEILSVFERAPR